MLKVNLTGAEAKAASDWDLETAAFLLQSFPAHFAALGLNAQDLRLLSAHGRDVARAFHILKGNQVRRLVVAMVALGAGMTDDPRFWSSVHVALSEYYSDETLRMDKVATASRAWTRVLWAEESFDAFGQRICARLRQPPSGTIWASADAFPQHASLLSPQVERQFQMHVWERSQTIGLDDPFRVRAFYFVALAHGVGWWQDPQCIALRRVFEQVTAEDMLISGLDRFYKGFAQ